MNHVFRRALSRVLPLILIMLFGLATTASAADLSGLTDSNIGLSYTEAGNGGTVKWAAAGTSLEGSIQGVKSGPFYKEETSTLSITNRKDVAALVSFDYSIVNNGGTVLIDGTACTGSGSVTRELAVGDSVTIAVTAARLTKVNTVTVNISGLSLVADRDAMTTFRTTEGGSYTVKKADGEVLNIEQETVLTQHSTQSYALQATADDGFVFFGWYNVTGNSFFSYSDTTTYMTDMDNTLVPVFVKSEYALFETGGKKFLDLNEASDYAQQQGLETIVLINSGYISGDFTIAEGVTLLIPFDDANTCFTNEPGHTGIVWTKPTAFRTLTLAEGSSITVNGAISVSARHTAGNSASSGASHLGSPSGPCGFIDMGKDAEIIISGTGKLYAWGYIIGDGTVTAQEGAEVYENIQFTDFRGGSASLVLAMGDYMEYGVFPLSQYYVQNVEVPMILESGANEYVWTSVTMNNQHFTAGVKFIGSGAMFVAEDGGKITKQYVSDRDRLQIDVDGSGSINSLTIELQGNRIDTSNYFLPLTNNLTINILSGETTISQDMSVLPGAEVNISEGAELVVGENSNLYFYDADDWDKYQQFNDETGEYYDVTGGNFVYNNRKISPLSYAPSRTYTRTSADVKDVLVDVNGALTVDGHIYTTRGGANVTSSKETGRVYLNAGLSQEYLEGEGYWFTFQAIQTAEVYLAYIPATSIKLHNGDGNYTETDDAVAGDIYIWSQHFNKWIKLTDATVTYDANGGAGKMDAVTVSKFAILDGTSQVTLETNGFTREHYTFGGWATTPNGEAVYEDEDLITVDYDLKLYAVWNPVSYTVKYHANDGWKATSEAVYGVEYRIPANNTFETEPAKYGYTFQGWATTEGGELKYSVGSLVEVSSDMDLYAVWKENTYTVSFKANGGRGVMDDAEIGQITLTDLPECSFLHDECSIVGWALSADGEVVYEDMEAITATEDMVLYAIWGEKSYKVTFIANGGEGTMKKQTIGTVTESALDANEFTREGYTFRVWNTKADGTGTSYVAGNVMTLSADVELYAVWDINQYDVMLDFNGGSVTDLGSTIYAAAWQADYNTLIKLKEFVPVNSHFELIGWASVRNATEAEYAVDDEIPVNEDLILYAVWQEKQATVSFDANGGTGTMESQKYGIVVGVKLAANGFTREGYTFIGWNTKADGTGDVFADGAQINLPEDTKLYAQWKINVYTVAWKDEAGTILEYDTMVAYGAIPSYDSETPTKVADTQYTYTFAGWTPEVTAVTGDTVYTATYTATVNKYTVTWKNADGTVLEKDVLAYGQTPTYDGKTPVKAATAKYTYTFSGWDKEIEPVTGTVTYSAVYTATVNQYTVTWKNADGTVLETDTVDYGTIPTYDGAVPTKTADAQYTYTFKAWDQPVSKVSGDAVYTATFTATVNQYTVTWKNADGTVLETDTVDYGTVPTYDGTVPTKTADAQYTYTFEAWNQTVAAVTGDVVFTATYTATVNQYTVTWKNADGTVLETDTVDYGTVPTYDGTVPAKIADNQYTYTFKAWDPEVAAVTGDAVYTATFEAVAIGYTVIWKDAEGNVLETDTNVSYGQMPTYDGETPVKEGYNFTGWDPEVVEVTGDAVYTAVFTEVHVHDYVGEVTLEATYSQPGVMTYTCECGDSYTEDIPRLGNPFVDVEEGRFYYDAVLWAVDDGITMGTTPTTFEPGSICTRAEFVTFLWRLAGKPEPVRAENPFVDVVQGKFYYKAVLWAVEQGVTVGTSATTFEPDEICTRGQVVTFLWRYAGKPQVEVENPFVDVSEARFYYKAVLWAVDNGITQGASSTEFEPEEDCTRGHTVTFLYRFTAKGIEAPNRPVMSDEYETSAEPETPAEPEVPDET